MGATFGLLAAIGYNGEIVWSYQSDERISNVERLRNGNIVFVTTDNRATEIDLHSSKNQVRWGIYGGARIAQFGAHPEN